MVMIDAADLGGLLEYKQAMSAFYQKAGDAGWLLQHQADYRTRIGQFYRVKRQGFKEYQEAKDGNYGNDPWWHACTPERPWNYVFDRINKDRDWWWEEPCMQSRTASNRRRSTPMKFPSDALPALMLLSSVLI